MTQKRETRKMERVVILVTPAEKAQLQQRAKRAKQSVAGVIRESLATPPKVKA